MNGIDTRYANYGKRITEQIEKNWRDGWSFDEIQDAININKIQLMYFTDFASSEFCEWYLKNLQLKNKLRLRKKIENAKT